MNKSMMPRLRSRRFWIVAAVFLLGLNFVIACGKSPTESRQLEKDKQDAQKDKK